jgi:hypothetical protein
VALAVVLWVLGAGPVSGAHYVLLKSGSELTGDLLKETPRSVYLDVGFEVLVIPRDDIRELRDLATEPAPGAEETTSTLRIPGAEVRGQRLWKRRGACDFVWVRWPQRRSGRGPR